MAVRGSMGEQRGDRRRKEGRPTPFSGAAFARRNDYAFNPRRKGGREEVVRRTLLMRATDGGPGPAHPSIHPSIHCRIAVLFA